MWRAQLPDNEEAGMVNAFEVKTGSGSVVVSAVTPQERTDWINLLNAMIEGTVTNAVFEGTAEAGFVFVVCHSLLPAIPRRARSAAASGHVESARSVHRLAGSCGGVHG